MRQTRASRFHAFIVIGVVLVLGYALSLPRGVSHAATLSWSPQHVSVLANAQSSTLNAIGAWSEHDIWAVGWIENSSSKETLVLHYDGRSWQRVSSPNLPGQQDNALIGLTVINPADIWAVGYAVAVTNAEQPLVEHYNGHSWSIVPTPSTNAQQNSRLLGVTSIAANNIWAVGYYTNDQSVYQTLIEHYDGSVWSIVPSPDTGANVSNELTSISAVSASNIWAVGYENNINTGENDPISLSWNGSVWSMIAIPTPDPTQPAQLNAVVALHANDVWAVGVATNAQSLGNQSLIEHWGGNGWGIVTNNLGIAEQDNAVYAATSLGQSNLATSQVLSQLNKNDVPALGSDTTVVCVGSTGGSALAAQWNGSSFALYPQLNNSGLAGLVLSGVDELTPTSFWMVGNGTNGQSNTEGAIVHYGTPVVPLAAPVVKHQVAKPKPQQGGNTGILILLIVVVGALGGGYYYWQHMQQ
ncbi:MAG: hypothetical protein ACP5OR_03220 [Candidatus Dormibacteria bacterium]